MRFFRPLLRALLLMQVGVVACSGNSKGTAHHPFPPRTAEAPTPDEKIPSETSVVGGVSHADLILPVDRFDPTWGGADAPVTIVQFDDFECRFSKKSNKTLDELMKTYGPEKLRIVHKAFPLAFRQKAPVAHDSAIAVLRLAGNAAFRRFRDLVFENQDEINETNLHKWAAEVGVAASELQAEIATGRPTAKVLVDQDLGRHLRINGTPASFVNGTLISGAVEKERFVELVEREIAETTQLVKNGVPASALYEWRLAANFELAAPGTSKGAAVSLEDGGEKWKLPVDATDPISGPKYAPVTIIIFSDFQCPFCARVLPTLERIRSEYGDAVRLVFKDNPLPYHEEGKPAARVARYVFEKKGSEAFWRAHDSLFADRTNLGRLVYQSVLFEAGLSDSAFRASNMKRLDEKIEASQELARDFDARGTPSFFINGRKLSGAQPFEKFKTLIDEQLIVAEAVLKSGVALEDVYEEMLKYAKEPPGEPEKIVTAPSADTPYLGNKNAKIVVQEFSDFQCPFCRRAEPTIAEFLKRHPGEVVFYFRHLPLPFHKEAPLAAEAAHEVFMQKGNSAFFRFRDLVFDHGGGGRAKVSRSELETIAQGLGVNMSAFKTALDTRKHEKRIEADVNAAKAAQITGTPAFVVGDVYISGAQPLSKFESAFKQAKKNAGL